MKTSSANKISKATIADDSFVTTTINKPIMKKLANTSPFLLLLLPVFMMMVFTLTINTNQNNTEEIVVKPAKNSASIIKQATAIFK
ncbi:MAG: hypothetical protein EOO96_21370 [Pedobacter sp.]|nr:MAG: hypothetical protein EOO96_21370 [Pedobacter sp.]